MSTAGRRGVFTASKAEAVLPPEYDVDSAAAHEYMNDNNLIQRQQRPMLPPRAPSRTNGTLNRNSTALNTVSRGAAGEQQAYSRRDNDLENSDAEDDEEDDDYRPTDDYEAGVGKVVVEPPPYIPPGSKPIEAFPKGVVIALVVAVIIIVLIVIGTVTTLIILFSRNYNKPYNYGSNNNNNGYGYYFNGNQGQGGFMNPAAGTMGGSGLGFGSPYGAGMGGVGMMPGSGMMSPGAVGSGGFGGMNGMGRQAGTFNPNYQN